MNAATKPPQTTLAKGKLSSPLDCVFHFLHTLQKRPETAFVIAITFIFLVSLYDTYTAICFGTTILQTEQNPVCLALLHQDSETFSYFFLGKVSGNLMVMLTLLSLKLARFRQYLHCTVGVALFQLGLFTYLIFSDPLTGILSFHQLLSHDSDTFRLGILNLVAHIAVAVFLLAAGYATWKKWKRFKLRLAHD